LFFSDNTTNNKLQFTHAHITIIHHCSTVKINYDKIGIFIRYITYVHLHLCPQEDTQVQNKRR